MTSAEIRNTFLEFFKSKGHTIVPSAPIVVKNDPTLMFTNAGMNQFKDLFLGNKPIVYPRIADTQKCLRVSGKHNDLEEVGIDTYHHTMFEMLGNWSFGDYFKAEAIAWSWELLTDIYKLDKDRLYVTVFEGDEKEGLPPSRIALEEWKKLVTEDHIVYGNKKDNFWEMGDTGPCGPCSEIHYDLRPEQDRKLIAGKDLVNKDHPQVIEIWNNVFIQFNRKADGSLEQLPAKHVDTGMGFERLVRVIQGKYSNYDTDVFQPLINFIEKKSGIKYEDPSLSPSERAGEGLSDIAMRVMADHIRAVSFCIADGQLPSNTGAGYVIRRILRRAVRYAYSYLNLQKPILNDLMLVLAEQFKDVFPELYKQKDFVKNVILEEENSFLNTLDKGLKRMNSIEDDLTKSKSKIIYGAIVFELYDTYGFPLDLTNLIAREKGFSVDEEGFNAEMQKQKDRSRKASAVESEDWVTVNAIDKVEFVGYDSLEAKARISKYRKQKTKDKEIYQVVLDITPFYAESGGQVGDKGVLEIGSEKISVIDTKKENDLIIHYTEKLPTQIDADLIARVNKNLRNSTINNHSATHLLQAAMRKVLGSHVEQRGSLVTPDYLRFDFSHFAKVTDEQLREIESIVNEKIRENIALNEQRNVPIAAAKAQGATALFGEKYGEFVRVITFDKNFSVELCGGTHVPSTGVIGYFKITSESAVAAGVRRIEALTGKAASDLIQQTFDTMHELNQTLKSPKNILQSITQLQTENTSLKKEIEVLTNMQVSVLKDELKKTVKEINGVNVIIAKTNLNSADALKKLAYDLKNEIENLFFAGAAIVNGKPQICVMISEELVKSKNLNAGTIIKTISKEINGGGGGQPFFASAGGTNADGIDKALTESLKFINN
jgi:alanyl-tRNA synthetase